VIDEHSIPKLWKRVLRNVQEVFPEAIIAGGALRDLDHGREIKDVDIFVLDKGDDTVPWLEALLGPSVSVLGQASEYHIGRAARPVTNVTTFMIEGQRFEVIAVKTTEPVIFSDYVLADFDLGICRIFYDGKKLVRSWEYQNNALDKTFTAYIPLSGRQLDLTKERVRRLSEKYPEFTSNLHYQEEEETEEDIFA
jgi:hypothetical protein